MAAGELKKLNITAYSDENFSSKGTSVSVLINPDEYTHHHSVKYAKDNQPPGVIGETTKFVSIEAETLAFKLVYDATGVLGSPNPCPDVTTKINELKKVIYNYNGDIHSPNYIQISWGTMLFKCRLTSMDVNYTLFLPNGNPLRAKITLNFSGYIDPVTLNLAAHNQSADLTHTRIVLAGDTLPMLCNTIYGNCAYYVNVAEHNNLINFRNIQPGDVLTFPPLSK